MTSGDIWIRTATLEDAKEILKIYALYVKKTAVTFEYDVPALAQFQARIKSTLEKYPYIIAERNGELFGYAYTGAFVRRAAYDWAAEVTIYLKEDKRKMGLGRKLYHAIEEISKAQNILNLNACISCPERENEYLTKNSLQFHAHLGYSMVGEFHKCGYKFGRWYNMVWMEKMIGEHTASPAPVVCFPDVSKEALRNIGLR